MRTKETGALRMIHKIKDGIYANPKISLARKNIWWKKATSSSIDLNASPKQRTSLKNKHTENRGKNNSHGKRKVRHNHKKKPWLNIQPGPSPPMPRPIIEYDEGETTTKKDQNKDATLPLERTTNNPNQNTRLRGSSGRKKSAKKQASLITDLLDNPTTIFTFGLQ